EPVHIMPPGFVIKLDDADVAAEHRDSDALRRERPADLAREPRAQPAERAIHIRNGLRQCKLHIVESFLRNARGQLAVRPLPKQVCQNSDGHSDLLLMRGYSPSAVPY